MGPELNASSVMVVDDCAMVCELVTILLQRAGFACYAYESATSAIPHAEDAELIISDLEMPGGGGLQLARDLRNSGLETPILFIHGGDNMDDLIEATRIAGIGYLKKPFEMPKLVEIVRSVIYVDAVLRDAISAHGVTDARNEDADAAQYGSSRRIGFDPVEVQQLYDRLGWFSTLRILCVLDALAQHVTIREKFVEKVRISRREQRLSATYGAADEYQARYQHIVRDLPAIALAQLPPALVTAGVFFDEVNVGPGSYRCVRY